MLNLIPPKSGVAFTLRTGERLRVRNPEGEQVSDLFCFNAGDFGEALSSSRSIDEAERIFLTTGHHLLSNRGRPMLTIKEDTWGRHDFLMPPCRESENGHVGCFENLATAFFPFDLGPDRIGTAFNIFMNVEVVPNGQLMIHTPHVRRGDEVVFEAQMDLIVGLTACAHLKTNGGRLKSIQWEIIK